MKLLLVTWQRLKSVCDRVFDRQKDEEHNKPIPSRLSLYLNEAQLIAINEFEAFGWKLFFVRRRALDEPVTVMKHNTGKFAVIDRTGELNANHQLDIRSIDLAH